MSTVHIAITATAPMSDEELHKVMAREVVPGMLWHRFVVQQVLIQVTGVRFCVAQPGESQCRIWRACIDAHFYVDVQLPGPSPQNMIGDVPDGRFRLWPAPMPDQIGAWTWDEEQDRYLAMTTTFGPDSRPSARPQPYWVHPADIMRALPSIYPRDVMLRYAFLAPAVPA